MYGIVYVPSQMRSPFLMNGELLSGSIPPLGLHHLSASLNFRVPNLRVKYFVAANKLSGLALGHFTE